MSFRPEIEGTTAIHTSGPEFLGWMRKRVAAGLLSGAPHSRSNYVATESGGTGLFIQAADWWTAINVGLNEVDLQIPAAGTVHYRVRYWRWAGYAIGLCASIGVIGIVFLLFTDIHSYIESRPRSMVPGFSTDQHVLFAWVMVVFWGFLWPWLLIFFHKGPLRRLVERLIAEVDNNGLRKATERRLP
jgi:hypothetical protein